MEDIIRISQVLQGLAVKADRLDLVERLKNLVTQQRTGISVAVIGNFGTGKSTLINALLGYELLPTSTSPTQSGYIRISITEQAIAIVQQTDGQQYTIAPVMPEIEGYLTEKLHLLDIQVQTHDFPPGMRVHEVSDIGGINPAQVDVLNSVLEQSNVVIFVTNGRTTLNTTEMSVLKNIPSTIHTLLVAVTHLDEIDSANQDAIIEHIQNEVGALDLGLEAQVFRTSGNLVVNKEYDLFLLNAWDEFRQTVINLPEATYVTQTTISDQVSILQQVANELYSVFSKASDQSKQEQQDNQEWRETFELLNRVIDDQTKDIEQTLNDNFNAFTFRLQNNLQDHLLSPKQIENEINSWLESETTSLKARYERLYRSVLSDAGSLIGKPLDFHPEILPVNPVRYTLEKSTSSRTADNLPRLSNLSGGQKVSLIGGGVAVMTGLFIRGPIGWALFIGGSAVAGRTLYFLFQREENSVVTLGKIEIPNSIIETVHFNSNRLQDYLKKVFSQKVDDSKTQSSPQDELEQIRNQLNHM